MIRKLLAHSVSALLLTLAFWPVVLLSQSNQEDVLYLNDGSVIRGEMIEYDTEGLVKIRIIGGTIMSYPFESVVKIERADRYPVHLNRGNIRSDLFLNHSGWYGFLEAGIGFISYDNPWNTLDTDIMLPRTGGGYRFNRWIGPGVSSGLHILPEGLIVIPLRAYVEGLLLPGAISPFYYAGGGYGFLTNPSSTNDASDKGGATFEAGLGLRFHTHGGTAFQARIGQNMQKVVLATNPWWWQPNTNSRREITFNAIHISFGVSF